VLSLTIRASAPTAPIRIPAITSGSTEEASAVARTGRHDVLNVGAGLGPGVGQQLRHGGLAAEAVSTFGPAGVATNAP
jgi:hypothetical protein